MNFEIDSIRSLFPKASIVIGENTITAIYGQSNGDCQDNIHDDSVKLLCSLLRNSTNFSGRASKVGVMFVFAGIAHGLHSMTYAPISREMTAEELKQAVDEIKQRAEFVDIPKDADDFLNYLSGENDEREPDYMGFNRFLRSCEDFARSINHSYEFEEPGGSFDGCAVFSFDSGVFEFDIESLVDVIKASSEIEIDAYPQDMSFSIVLFA